MGKYDKDNRTVVFDIDGVIASAPERGGHEKEVCAYVEGRFGKNFLADHSIEAAGYIHLVYPGIPEFIRWLVRRNVRIHFCSTGVKRRNDELVPKVMNAALKDESDETRARVLKGMRVFSREDLVRQQACNKAHGLVGATVYGGEHHKILCPYIVNYDNLPNTLLIDDDVSYMAFGEEYNFVGGKYYGYFYRPDGRENAERRREDFIELCRGFLFAGVVSEIFKLSDSRKFCSLTEASKIVQYGDGPEAYVPEDRTFFQNTYQEPAFYKAGLKALKTVNPELEFPLPLPKSLRDKDEKRPVRLSDAERLELRQNIDERAAEFMKDAAERWALSTHHPLVEPL